MLLLVLLLAGATGSGVHSVGGRETLEHLKRWHRVLKPLQKGATSFEGGSIILVGVALLYFPRRERLTIR